MKMNIKLIAIDTNGDNAHKYRQSLELYDLIAPNIIFLIDWIDNVYMADEMDWVATRMYFSPDQNGHCICGKDGGYAAAYEFTHMGIIVKKDSIAKTLSELCSELAEDHNINENTFKVI